MPGFEGSTSVLVATEVALKAAQHLTAADAGAVQALRALAAKIDSDDAVRVAYLDWQDGGDRPARALQVDNVSLPTYLKYCESLGLTPAGRKVLSGPAKQGGGGGGNLGRLRSVQTGRKSA